MSAHRRYRIPRGDRLPRRTRILSWWARGAGDRMQRWLRRIDLITVTAMALGLMGALLVTIRLAGDGSPAPRPTSVTGPAYRLYQPGLAWQAAGYEFKYGDASAQIALAPYVDRVRAQLTAVTGVPFGVASTTGLSAVGTGTVFVVLQYRPCSATGSYVGAGNGVAGESCGSPMVDAGVVTGGVAYFDSEYWLADGSPSTFGAGPIGLRNLVTHEVGHALGLAHPNASGVTSTAGDCVAGNDGGELPVMCSGTGGVGGYTDDRAGEYVQQFDVQGLRALAAAGGAALPPQGAIHGIAGKCLDVDTPGNVDVQNGRKVQIWDCNGAPQQQWIAAPDGTLRVLGRCLDDYAAGTSDGNPIVLWVCNGTGWQGWRHNADGTYLNTYVSKYLDDKYASTANGTPVWLWHYTGTAAQLWTVPGVAPAVRR